MHGAPRGVLHVTEESRWKKVTLRFTLARRVSAHGLLEEPGTAERFSGVSWHIQWNKFGGGDNDSGKCVSSFATPASDIETSEFLLHAAVVTRLNRFVE